MDIDNLLSSAIKLSSFITTRLLFFLALAVLIAPYFGVTDATSSDIAVSVPILEGLIDQYGRIIDALGIQSVAIYLLFFVFISTLHVCYEAAVLLGSWVPLTLSGQKLQLVERRFSKATVEQLLAHNVSSDIITRFTAAAQECNDKIDPGFTEAVTAAGKSFNAIKAYLVVFVVCVFVVPSEVQVAEVADYGGLILAGLLALTAIAAFRRVDTLRTRYLEFIDDLEDCLEKHLRPTVPPGIYGDLAPIPTQFRKAFFVQPDWTLPIFGSLREILAWQRDLEAPAQK